MCPVLIVIAWGAHWQFRGRSEAARVAPRCRDEETAEVRHSDPAMRRAVLLAWGLALLGCSPSRGEGGVSADASVADSDALCSTGSGPFPRPLELPNAEPGGVFDANLARDQASGRLWMSYSGVTGPAGSGFVSTHLAYSDDDGTTWCDQGTVNAAAPVPESDQPSRVAGPDGHWNHEVPALAYDAEAPAERRWTLVWHRYLHVADDDPATDDRRFEYGWIAIRSAATAPGLMTAPERKLFSSLAYHVPDVEAYNEAVAGGSPEKRWDVDPDLGGCLVFTEPGILAAGGKLYIAMYCFQSRQDQDVVLVAFSHASGAWSHLGTLLTTADAVDINPALVGFNAPDLYSVGSSTRLIVSPTTGSAYLGCIEYGLDLAAGALVDSNGDGPDPLLGIEKNPDGEVFQTGACSYQEGISTGIVLGDTYFSGVQFRLVATGRVP